MVIRWGVIGAGGVAHRRTMSAIKEAKNSKLQALMVRDRGRAKKLAREHGALSYYDSVDGILSDPAVDAVYIATPVYLHCEHVIRAAEQGKHVLCEKPMGMNVEECKRMIDACNDNGVHLEVCFLLRFHPFYTEIKQLIEYGELGEIVEARATLLKQYNIEEGLWRRDPARSGGGVLMDIGSHTIDLLMYLLGDVLKVIALTNSQVTGWEIEDTATVLMQMQSGVQAIVDTSFAIPYSESMLEVYGTKGSAFVTVTSSQQWGSRIYIHDSVRSDLKPYENLYKPQVEHFSRCVSNKEETITPGIAGLKNIQVISAAYESARTGKFVSLPVNSP